MDEKTFFMKVTKKLYQRLPKKIVFRNAKNCTFEHTETFLWQNVLFFCHIHEKCLHNHFLIFKQQKAYFVNKSIC